MCTTAAVALAAWLLASSGICCKQYEYFQKAIILAYSSPSTNLISNSTTTDFNSFFTLYEPYLEQHYV